MFGGKALQVVHLNGAQWGYSIALGFLSIPVAIVTRCVSDDTFQKIIPRRWWPHLSSHGREGAEPTDWDSALLKVREETELVSLIHDGRLHACGWGNTSHRRPSLKPVTVMAGLIAGSIGGWPRT